MIAKYIHTTLLALCVTLLAAGCGRRTVVYTPAEPKQSPPDISRRLPPTQPVKPKDPAVQHSPAPTIRQPGPAHALIKDAERAMQGGDFQRAEILVERALRVEPGNGWYWHTLGKVQYKKGATAQAQQFFLKSSSLAGNDRELLQRNQSFMQTMQK